MAKALQVKSKSTSSELTKLIESDGAFAQPKKGDVVKGTVISASKAEIRLDVMGIRVGVVRGRELYNDSDEYGSLQPGQEVEATVIELENERGELELSFKYAGQQRAWEQLRELVNAGTVIPVKIVDANKGGLMVKVGSTPGFLPVSQLIPEHYPRVEGGDKSKILEALKRFVGESFNVKVLDADEREGKLIVSEKAAWEEEQQKVVSAYKVGQRVKGAVTAVTDFGVFISFDAGMEGLIHISELAWQRIDDPRDVVKIGQEVEAEIINVDGTKIFLSMKKLKQDPWATVEEKYKVGEVVKGKVLKVNPFGLFVELDPEIHGLAHISELSEKQVGSPEEVAKAGETREFKIISIEPKNHRLGLSIKALTAKATSKASAKKGAAEEKGVAGDEKSTKKTPAKKVTAKKSAKKK